MRFRATLLSLTALAVLAAPPELRAQGQNPTIASHTFVPNTLVEGPFLATHFRSMVGLANAFGYSILTVPTPGDTVISIDGKMTWVLVEFAHRQKVSSWLSLEGSLTGGARVGTNTASAIADGVSVITSVEAGGLARVVETERVTASASLDARWSGLTLLNIVGFVEEIIDSVESGGPIDSISLSSNSGALQMRGGFRLAYAPAPVVGFTFLSEVGVGQDYAEIEEAALDLTLGATVSFNLHSIEKAPLGFVAGYRFSTFSDRSETSDGQSHIGVVGVSYVGKGDFTVGVEFQWQHTPLADGDNLSLLGLGVRSRYYF
jgi:hypothetical protein